MAGLAFLAASVLGCPQALNYEDPAGPRFAKSYGSPPEHAPEALRVVTFNIQFSRHIDRALGLLEEHPQLRDADLLLLQEMDAQGVDELAQALGMSYVYYPAVVHPKTDRDFGNAVLSRWPIVDDAKLVLPHEARFDHSRRTATRVTVQLGDTQVLVYSAHLATPIDLGEGDRKDQFRAILDDAGDAETVIIGGDFNDRVMAVVAARKGWQWPTRFLGRTSRFGGVDHVVTRGFADSSSAGKVKKNEEASDHFPVWVELALGGG
jgi:endonuclease/exonuclease/phosphatase family metal-dependent hydrolase